MVRNKIMLKCIIWDLDNTIWDGTLLENSNVVLKENSVRILEAAHDRGIIQTICSKNDFENASEKLELLGIHKFFVYPQINMCRKSDNIKSFLNDMHFRAEDVLFVDDMEFELEEVRFSIPGIDTINISDYRTLEKKIYAEEVKNAEQVERRTYLYKMEETRLYERSKYHDISAFLMQSSFKVHIDPAKESELPRIEELLERTHQLNTTGIAYSREEIRDMLGKENWLVLIGSVSDKYGDYGKSALLIAKKNSNEYVVKVMIISCRLMGKGITDYLLFYLYRLAFRRGIKKLIVEYRKNKYNRSMQVLLQMNDFIRNEISPDFYQFYIDVKDSERIKSPEWICEV